MSYVTQEQLQAAISGLWKPNPYAYSWADLGAVTIGTYTFTLPAAITPLVKAVNVWLEMRSQGVNGKCSIQDIAGNQYASAICQVTNAYATCGCTVLVDSNKQFKVVISTAAVYACLVGMSLFWK